MYYYTRIKVSYDGERYNWFEVKTTYPIITSKQAYEILHKHKIYRHYFLLQEEKMDKRIKIELEEITKIKYYLSKFMHPDGV